MRRSERDVHEKNRNEEEEKQILSIIAMMVKELIGQILQEYIEMKS